ncbi:arylsulfatase B [Rubinisphaera margarita]|uniref:arylsulfatase B n=1 Tax=Rubinisphaera margarita TaxID=2909586 RepID=UPI001EE8769A|nr:arylsulfatase [Rubinisphaera margarita]MCG6157597.1 arylsulfatase [Rubinisphaera margarita]
MRMLIGRVLVLSGIALLALTSSPAAAEQPHIVMMLADDLGWGDVGYHGSRISTPNIDKLAARGVQFNQFYVQPVCSPTRASLMSGRYPMRYGLQCGVVRPWADYGLPLDERTLPQALNDVGYETAVCGKWHLGHSRPEYLPTSRGFDHQYGHYNGAIDYFKLERDGGHDWHRNDKRLDEEGYSTNLIADEASRLIKEHDQSRPLFLYVPFNAPHTPLQAPQKYIDQYKHFKQKDRQVYAAMVTCMDDAVGQIVDALETAKFPTDNTLIFFCSDNGGIPKLGSNRELRSGKGRLYEGGVRVPAVMVWENRLPAGGEVNAALHIVDLYPTFLKLAGASLEQEKPLDGRDAWPAIADGAESPHEYILHNTTPFHGALRSGPWKVVHNGDVTSNTTADPGQNVWELFNIEEDPSEENDVSARRPRIFERLKKQLADLASQAHEPNIPPNRAPDDFTVPAVWGEFN